MAYDLQVQEDGKAWGELTKQAIEQEMTPEYIAKKLKRLAESRNENVSMQAVKEVLSIGGVGGASSTSTPRIVLNVNVPAQYRLDNMDGKRQGAYEMDA